MKAAKEKENNSLLSLLPCVFCYYRPSCVKVWYLIIYNVAINIIVMKKSTTDIRNIYITILTNMSVHPSVCPLFCSSQIFYHPLTSGARSPSEGASKCPRSEVILRTIADFWASSV